MAAALTKVAQKIFGISAGTDEISKFGSLAAGSPAFTTDPAQVQSLSNYLEGWYAAIIDGNAPPIEDMNSLFFLLSYQIAYLQQRGVAAWDATTEYFTGSLVNAAGVLYISQQDNNINHAISDVSWWLPSSSDAVGVGKDYWGGSLPSGYVWASGKTIGNASSNATERANADTINLFTLLWARDATAFPIYTSAGVLSTRGASAALDFAANKAIITPDKRGRVSAGLDDLGGTAANRLTSTTMTPGGTTLGAVGGTQTHVLVSGEMPSHTHTQNSHNHTQDAHAHNITDPGHSHSWIRVGTSLGTIGDSAVQTANNINNVSTFNANNPLASSTTGITINSTTATNQAATATNNNTGGGGAHLNVQPTILCNYIVKL